VNNFIVLFFTMVMLPLTPIRAQIDETLNTAELTIALHKLNVLGSILYIGAHPDDENIALLTYFSKGRKYRSAYLSITRGEGGQNLIGSEQGAEIGIIRTQELLAARRIDGAEQFFTRAVDFGYSKTADESFRFWGRENTLADIVWVIRRFQPDIIITRFAADSMGGHGHHTAATILTQEAFAAAGDPHRFPEQLAFTTPWKVKRLIWNSFRRSPNEPAAPLRLDTGIYNPLLGKSYAEMAGPIRSLHKSQGFGSTGRRGAQTEQFEVIAGDPAAVDLFEGIDTSWKRLPGGEPMAELLTRIIAAFDPLTPEKSIPGLLDAYNRLDKLPPSTWADRKREEFLAVIRSCAGLWLEALADDFAAAPGDFLRIKTAIINRSALPITLRRLRFPRLAPDAVADRILRPNEPQSLDTQLAIPLDFSFSQPYWLENPPTPGMVIVSDQRAIGLAEQPPALTVLAELEIAGRLLEYRIPVGYRWTDPVAGEQYRTVEIRPRLTATFATKVQIFTRSQPSVVPIRIKSHSPQASGTLRLAAPASWSVHPATIPLNLKGKFEELSAVFRVTPPKAAKETVLRAEIDIGGQIVDRSLVEITYPHIHRQVYFPTSEIKAVVLDVTNAANKIGYIMGAGDEVAEATRHLGCEVTILDDEMLDTLDLSTFDAIITGVRAFNTRERLILSRERLLRYVEGGGTLVIQYNVTTGQPLPLIAPYPLTPGRDRVCEETAAVTILDPGHPLLRFPNRITLDDFNGWIQERGLNFPSQWDDHYQALLATRDSGEPDRRGGLLYARYGKGVYIHSSLSWFRQLPAGIPGAFRIWANLISAGKENGSSTGSR